MSKKKEVSGVALAEPVRTTAEEIMLRRQQEEARKQADATFYAEVAQRIAAGSATAVEQEAAEMVAAALGYDLRRDVDQLKKIARWEADGYLAADAPGFAAKHDELFNRRNDLIKRRGELEDELSKVRVEAEKAEYDRHKYFEFGNGIVTMRKGLAHILGGGQ